MLKSDSSMYFFPILIPSSSRIILYAYIACIRSVPYQAIKNNVGQMIIDDINKTGEHNTFSTSYFTAINSMNRNPKLKSDSCMCLSFPFLLPSISRIIIYAYITCISSIPQQAIKNKAGKMKQMETLGQVNIILLQHLTVGTCQHTTHRMQLQKPILSFSTHI